MIGVNSFTRKVVWFNSFIGEIEPNGIICVIRDEAQPYSIGANKNWWSQSLSTEFRCNIRKKSLCSEPRKQHPLKDLQVPEHSWQGRFVWIRASQPWHYWCSELERSVCSGCSAHCRMFCSILAAKLFCNILSSCDRQKLLLRHC